MIQHKIAVVIDANGKAAIGVFDATSGAMLRTVKASEQVNQAGERGGRIASEAGQRWTGMGRNASEAMGAASRNATGLTGVVDRVKSSVAQLAIAFAGIQGARQLAAISDGYTNLSSKLRLVTEDEASLQRVRTRTLAIAQDTRSSFESTANLYARLTRATADLGLQEQQRLRITETINKAFVVSGATAQEASNAIIQLSQGLAAGALRGEEFNSVAEQAPILMDMLGKSLGKTRGELREMAAEGKITAQVLTTALLAGAADVDRQFDQTALTIGGATQRLKNALTDFVGGANEASGVSAALALGISGLASVFGPVVTGATALATVMGTNYVAASVKAALADAARQKQLTATAAAELRAAETAEAVALARLNTARVTTGTAAAEQAYAAAVARTTAAQQASAAASAASASRLARLGSAATALVGGPIGLAVAGIAGLTLLIKHNIDAEETRQAAWQAGMQQSAQAVQAVTDKVRALTAELEQAGHVGLGGTEASLRTLVDASDELARKREELANKTAALQQIEADMARAQTRMLVAAETGSLAAAAEYQRLQQRASELRAEVGAARRAVDELTDSTVSLKTAYAQANPQLAAGAQAIGQIKAAFAGGWIGGIRELIGSLGELGAAGRVVAADQQLKNYVDQFTKQVEDAQQKLDKHNQSLATWREEQQAAAIGQANLIDATGELAESLRQQFAEGEKLIAQAGALSSRQRTVTADTHELTEAERLAAEAAREMADALAEAERGNDGLDERIRDLRDELAGLTPEQREYNRALEETVALMAQQLALGPPDADQAALLAAYQARLDKLNEMLGLQNQLANRDAETQAANDVADANIRAAEESDRAWRRFSDDFAAAILDGTESVKDFFKRMLDDIKRQILSSGIQSLLRGLFGGGGTGGFNIAALFGGGGGGTGGLNLGNLLGSGGGGFNAAIPWLAAAGGALYGFQNRGNGGASSLAAGLSYGALGYTGATVLGGAALGAAGTTAGAGIGAAAGGAATGAMGAAAAVPVIGWIAAIAALVDVISGGKLFGTKYRPESSTSTLAIGADGGDASLSLREVRQRSLFRGRQWRDREQDPGTEAEAAAEAFWQQQADASAHYADLLGSEVAPVIEASIQTIIDYDKKGREKARRIMVEILGRSWAAGSPEEAATRIAAEQMIASIDAALSEPIYNGLAKVRAVVDQFGNEIGGGGGTPREPSDPLGADAGEASRIAERWRGDAEQLLSGAQFLLSAATDLQHGFSLIGTDGPGSLTEITDLVEELARGDESLIDTYGRLQASTQMMRDALALMGITVSETGADFVRWSTDFVDAAGGIQNAQALMSGYMQTFYTEVERLTLSLTNARALAAGEFGDIGLDVTDFEGKGGLQRFRELFESVFDDLSAEMQVEWLQAANALGVLTEAEQALAAARADGTSAAEQQAAAEEAAARAAQNAADLAELLNGLRWDDYLAGLSDYERQVAELNRSFDEHAASAVLLGATQAQLAEIELLRANAIERLAELQEQAANDQWYQDYLNRLEQAQQDYAQRSELLEQLRYEESLRGLSAYERSVADLNRQFDDYRATLAALGAKTGELNELEAIRAARLDDLAEAEAARMAAEIGGVLEGLRWDDSLRGLSDYDRQLAEINRRFDDYRDTLIDNGASEAELAELETYRLHEIADLVDQRYEGELRWLQQLIDYRDSLLLNDQLTTLTPAEQLAEARRQYDAVAAAALAGDADALNSVRGVANAYLDELRGYFGSAQGYTDGYADVMALLDTLIGDGATTLGSATTGPTSVETQVTQALNTIASSPLAGNGPVVIEAQPIVQPLTEIRDINRDGFQTIDSRLQELIARVERVEAATDSQTAEIRRGNDLAEQRTE